jgi:hypothetical protein
MRRGTVLLVGALVGALLAVLPGTMLRATASTVADWRMNEGRHARTMHDATGAHDARIGRRVTPGGGVYRFVGGRSRSTYDPQRVIAVPESDDLDPQNARFQIEMRLRTTGGLEPNLMQKGQHGQRGGFFKLALFEGKHPRCGFHDASGRVRATGRRDLDVTDGRWWTLRCTATRHETRLVVLHRGHRYVAVQRGPLGSVDNDQPLAIGGKLKCAQSGVDCDYFRGEMDYVVVRKWS